MAWTGTVSNIFVFDAVNMRGILAQIDEWVYRVAASGREVTSVATSPVMPRTDGMGGHNGTLGFLVVVSWRSGADDAPAGSSAPTAEPLPAVPATESHSAAYLVVLERSGDRKIEVIKVVRKWTRLGLKETKELVDNAPRGLVTGLSSDQARAFASELQDAGASTTIKPA